MASDELANPLPASGSDVGGAGGWIRRAVSSSSWALGGFGGAQLIRLVGNLTLTRLLTEADFGLMALVSAVLLGIGMFSDWGIGQAIVQSDLGENRRFLGTMYSLQIVRGALIWGAAALVASSFASFYGHPELAWVIPIAGLSSLIDGFASLRIHSASRKIQLSRTVSLDLVSQSLGVATMIAWAWHWPSVVAMLAGGIVAAFARTVLSHFVLLGPRDHFDWDMESLRRLAVFAQWILVSTIITFFAVQSDRLVLGKLVSLAQLGVYNIAAGLAVMPASAIGALGGAVTFPLYSRALERTHDPRIYSYVRAPVSALAGWAMSFMIAAAPDVVKVLYDPRYWGAGWIIQVLTVGMWFVVLDGTIASALLARGRVTWIASSNAGKLLGFAALAPLGYWAYGFTGVVAAVSLSEVVRYAVAAFGAKRSGLPSIASDARFTVLTIAAGLALYEIRSLPALASLHPIEATLMLIFASAVVWVPVTVFCVRRLLRIGG